MKKITFIILAIFYFNALLYSQQDTFMVTLDTMSFIDAFKVLQTYDGGWIIGGGTSENFDDRYVAIKLNADGDTIWKTMTHEDGIGCRGNNLCINFDSSYVLVGRSNEYANGALDPYHVNGGIIRLNKNGEKIWSKSYGGAPGPNEYAYDFEDELVDVCVTNENKIVGVGFSTSYPAELNFQVPWIVCVDQDGNQLWDYFYRTSGDLYGLFVGVSPTSDGGVIAVGHIIDPDKMVCFYNAVMVKVSSDGDVVWEKTWRRNGFPSLFRSIKPMNNGNYAICGAAYRCMSDTYECLPAPLITVINDDGEVQWSKLFVYQTDLIDSWARDICVTPDDDLIITGAFSFPEVYNGQSWGFGFVIKTDDEGNIIWDRLLGNQDFMSSFNSICYNYVDSSFSMVGDLHPSDTTFDYTIFIKTDSLGISTLPLNTNFILNFIENNLILHDLKIYPNPVEDILTIELPSDLDYSDIMIYNIYGQKQTQVKINNTLSILNVAELKTGLYIIKTKSGLQAKFIKL
jgi:hypothetical protein